LSTGEAIRMTLNPRRSVPIVVVYTAVFFVLLPLMLAHVGSLLDELFQWNLQAGAWRSIGIVLGAVGLAGVAWTMAYLGRWGIGLPISHLPPARFVSTGPYGVSRHPIYVAYSVAFIGMGMALGSPGQAFAAGFLLVAGWLIYVLGFEEPKLVKRFGATYREYCETVPIAPFPGRRATVRLASSLWGWLRPAVEKAANHVVMFKVGPTIWVTYGALLGLGAVAMTTLTGGLLVQGGSTPTEATLYLVSLAAASLVGGRFIWLVYQWHDLVRDPVRVLRTVGFVSWGAILVTVLFPFLYASVLSREPLWVLARTLIGLAACGAIGRLGCLTYGCCFGRESRFGIFWAHPDAKVNRTPDTATNQPRVPTQLMEAAWLSVVLIIAFTATRTAVPAGAVSGLILVLYALGRFAADCLRDEGRFGGWKLTSGQVGSLVFGIAGLVSIYAANGPPGWPEPAYMLNSATVISVWPAIAACAALVFLVTGFHWRRVGRW
jgi:prolipoprotein diacylglyceryltransferase/protein-S-isoprenylcysteine O-methyltransferase Ste14